MKLKFFFNLIKEVIKIKLNMRELDFKVQKIDENFFVLGNAYAYIYFIKIDKLNILIDTGTAFFGNKVSDYLKYQNIEEIDYLLLTHSHYDHIGGVPIILKNFRVKNIFAHGYLKNVFKSEKAISIINNLNKIELSVLDPFLRYEFKPFEITNEVKENDFLDFGKIKILFYETPGHTKDSVSYYILPYKIIIPGEAIGVPNKDDSYILPQFLSSFENYIESINKIKNLDIEIIGLPHEHLIFGRENVKNYIENSLKTTYDYAQIIENSIIKYKNFNKILDYLTDEIHQKKNIRQPIHAFKENLKAQIIAISRFKNLHIKF